MTMQEPDQHACSVRCRFNAEMAHELAGAQRPGVRSRFPQPLPAFGNTRAQLEVRLLVVRPTVRRIKGCEKQ